MRSLNTNFEKSKTPQTEKAAVFGEGNFLRAFIGVLYERMRGTPFATFVPTLKIATNRSLAKKKSNWIDFDAESGNEDELWEKMLKVCSGERCKAEDKREIAYFKRGVTL